MIFMIPINKVGINLVGKTFYPNPMVSTYTTESQKNSPNQLGTVLFSG